MNPYKNISLWFDTLDEVVQPRPALQSDLEVDVAIIGCGYTGLWTAYYLQRQRPDLSIVIVESETAGFGASGRNGGWLMSAMSGELKIISSMPASERPSTIALLFGIIDEVDDVLEREKIDCDLHRGGAIYAAARYPEQIRFQREALVHFYQSGFTEQDYRWLSDKELQEQIRFRNGYGAIYTPHCATINPAKLVRGLARCVESKGVRIFEKSPVLAVEGKTLCTASGRIRANVIVPATEGFTDRLMNIRHYVLPVQSLIVATEPLSQSQWDEIGLAQRPAFSDASRLATYGHRSMDDRLVFGARGTYDFGGKVRDQFSLDDLAFRERETLVHDLFPSLQNTKFTHGWGGTLGIARNFSPFAIFDVQSGIAHAGGYGGEGVGASNLFGRTLADLILQQNTELTSMPWAFQAVTHTDALKRWEPEPIRWLIYQTLVKCFAWEEKLYGEKDSANWSKKLAGLLCDRLATIME